MARGKRPATFRTRKLSLSAPMVLPRRRGGRVGRRRTTIPERAPATRLGPFRRPRDFVYRKSLAAANFLRRGAHVVGQPVVQRTEFPPGGTDFFQRLTGVQPLRRLPAAAGVQCL